MAGWRCPASERCWALAGRSDDDETFYKFSSFTTPGTVYRLDLITREVTVFPPAGAGL